MFGKKCGLTKGMQKAITGILCAGLLFTSVNIILDVNAETNNQLACFEVENLYENGKVSMTNGMTVNNWDDQAGGAWRRLDYFICVCISWNNDYIFY